MPGNPNPDQSGLKPNYGGEVRNPKGTNGYTKQKMFTDALIKFLETNNLADPFVQAGVKRALKGDYRYWSYIFDRMEGKMSGEPDGADTVEIVKEAKKRHLDRKRSRRTDGSAS